MNKEMKWTFCAALMLLACTGNKGVAHAEEGEAALADVPAAPDTLVFEEVSYNDSLIADVKIMDYSTDEEPTPYTMGKSRNYFEKQTLKAVKGPKESMEFVNQYLLVDASGVEYEPPLTTAKISELCTQLKKEGVSDVKKALKKRSKDFLGTEAPFEEMGWETGNSLESEISVAWNTKNLLTLQHSGYDYPAGAAHGMPWNYAETIDLKNKRILTKDDIFTKSGQKAVLRMVVAELLDEYAEDNLNNVSDIELPGNDPSLTSEGVQFDYGAYEIGPYALGMPCVKLPYEKVKPYLTPEVMELIELK